MKCARFRKKLISLGYLNDKVDGIYGEKTRKAVVAFKRTTACPPTALPGPKTSARWASAQLGQGQFSSSDIDLLARIISAESRGEPYSGQVAVGAVIPTALSTHPFPTPGGRHLPARRLFVPDGRRRQRPVADSAYRAARDAINGQDPSGMALFTIITRISLQINGFFSRPVITVSLASTAFAA